MNVGRVLRTGGTTLIVALGLVSPILATTTPAPASADVVVDGCTIVSNPTPTDFTNCPNDNLSGTNLSGLDLSYANLSGAQFVDCPTGHCVGANLHESNLTQADLSGAVLSFCAPTPSGATACRSADLSDSTLVGTDFAQASAQDVIFLNAELRGANLTDANLGGADLVDADLTGANLTGTLFSSLLPPEFSGGSPLTANANLTNAIFTGTILLPSDQNAMATSQAGTTVSWSTPPGIPGATLGSCSPASGSSFPLGSTTVTCQVVGGQGDVPGAEGTGTFTVDVANPGEGTPEAPIALLLPVAALALLGGALVRKLR